MYERTICVTISRKWAEPLIKEYFKQSGILSSGTQLSIEYDYEPEQFIPDRRKRIVEIMQRHQKKAEGKNIIVLEDDSIPKDRYALQRLEGIRIRKKAKYVTAMEINRWNSKHVGAYKVFDYGKPYLTGIMSLPLKKSGIQRIDAGGWFCFATNYKTFKNNKFELCPDKNIGPDVWWTYKIKARKYIDWQIICKHYCSKNYYLDERDFQNIIMYNKKKWEIIV